MNDPAKQLGTRIKSLRVAADLSQHDAAVRCGLQVSYYSALERGKKNPTLATLAQVADGLGISLEELLAEDLAEIREFLDGIPARARPAVIKLLRQAVECIRQASREASPKTGRR